MSKEIKTQAIRCLKTTSIAGLKSKGIPYGNPYAIIAYAFDDLVKILPQEKGSNSEDEVEGRFDHLIGDIYYAFPEAQTQALGKLVKAIKDGMEESYLKGKEEGKKAIQMLASGEITLEQFDKK